MKAVGVDIGGSGIKGAAVDTDAGSLLSTRIRIPTPNPSTPEAVAETVARLVAELETVESYGCTFPAIIQRGIVQSAANVDASWIGVDGSALLQHATGQRFTMLNDADAAGIAEMTFGAGRGHMGVVMILTFGTGIGSAIFTRGELVPNSELGHLKIRGRDAEHRASDRARKDNLLSWEDWAVLVDEYLAELEALFSPDLFIVGGGVSKDHEHYLHRLTTRAPIVPAQLRNEAGIVGAALAAVQAAHA